MAGKILFLTVIVAAFAVGLVGSIKAGKSRNTRAASTDPLVLKKSAAQAWDVFLTAVLLAAVAGIPFLFDIEGPVATTILILFLPMTAGLLIYWIWLLYWRATATADAVCVRRLLRGERVVSYDAITTVQSVTRKRGVSVRRAAKAYRVYDVYAASKRVLLFDERMQGWRELLFILQQHRNIEIDKF